MSSETEKLNQESRRLIDELLCVRSHNINANSVAGGVELNVERLKTLKKFLRQNEQLLQPFFEHLLDNYFCKDNVMVRLYGVVLVDEIFRRSHRFRECVIENFEEFLKYAAETDPLRHPLPQPKTLAKNLKERTLKIVHSWYNTFGKAYRKLQVAYEYLKSCKTFDFQRIEAETIVERERSERERRRQDMVNERVVKKVSEDLQEIEDEMQKTLTEINNAFRLLVPDLSIGDDLTISDMTACGSDARSSYWDDEEPSSSPASSQPTESEVTSLSTTTLQAHGIPNQKFDMSISIRFDKPPIALDQDNIDLINTVKDCSKLIASRYLPKMRQLLNILSQYGGDQKLTKTLIDWRMRLDEAKRKFDDLRLQSSISPLTAGASAVDEEEADFEVVPEKEGLEEMFRPPSPSVPIHIREWSKSDAVGPKKSTGVSTIGSGRENGDQVSWRESILRDRDRDADQHSNRLVRSSDGVSQSVISKHGSNRSVATDQSSGRFPFTDQGTDWLSICDRSGDQSSIRSSATSQSSSVSGGGAHRSSSSSDDNDQRPSIPTVPFGIDLEYWGQEKITKPMILRNNADCHRFWRPSDGEDTIQCSDMEAEAYRTRVMQYVGEFRPVERECRALLGGKDAGKLCTRRDRYRCPFHGVIVDRDDHGRPLEKPDGAVLEEATRSNPRNANVFGDTEFLQDIEQATGKQLTISKKERKRNRAEAHADASTSGSTSRERLQKKVFNRSAIKRVAAAQEALDRAKQKKKFAGQWQYVFRDQ